MPVIHQKEMVFKNTNILLQGAEILGLPFIVTEQYPKGLGKTCPEIILPPNSQPIEKMCFSCMQSQDFLNQLKPNYKNLILCGVETHICVLKTALDAINADFKVHIVADAASSRSEHNKQLALERIKQVGGFITSTEMILFMLINEAGNDTFKAISKLIK